MIDTNGTRFEGNHIEVNDGEVKIDGKKVEVPASDNLEIHMTSNNEPQTANVTIGNGNIKIHQSSKSGDNNMKISF